MGKGQRAWPRAETSLDVPLVGIAHRRACPIPRTEAAFPDLCLGTHILVRGTLLRALPSEPLTQPRCSLSSREEQTGVPHMVRLAHRRDILRTQFSLFGCRHFAVTGAGLSAASSHRVSLLSSCQGGLLRDRRRSVPAEYPHPQLAESVRKSSGPRAYPAGQRHRHWGEGHRDATEKSAW